VPVPVSVPVPVPGTAGGKALFPLSAQENWPPRALVLANLQQEYWRRSEVESEKKKEKEKEKEKK
jgi:hypothetical protein